MGRIVAAKGWQKAVLPWVRMGLTLAGLLTIVLLVRSVGTRHLLEALRPAAPWLPLLIMLEGLRIITDSLATWAAFGPKRQDIPTRYLLRAHLVGYAIGSIAPAGRTAAEATKAAMLSPWVGGAAATAVATTNQAVTLFGVALISVPCTMAAYSTTGMSLLTVLLFVHTLVAAGAGLVIRVGARAHGSSRWLSRRFERLAKHAPAFHEAARGVAIVPLVPMIAVAAERLMQVLGWALLAHAISVHVTLNLALLAQGLSLIAMAAGILVPGQVGATEGAFALASGTLGLTVADALSIALLSHVVQSLWVAVGVLTPVLWKVPEEALPPPPPVQATVIVDDEVEPR